LEITMRDDMSDPESSALLARYLSDECSEEERSQVEAWIDANPAQAAMMEQMTKAWQTREPTTPASDVEAMWQEIGRRRESGPDRVRTSKPGLRLLRYAAVLAVGLGLSYVLSQDSPAAPVLSSQEQMQTVSVAVGERSQVDLSDGTVVTLDAGSRLIYPLHFDSLTRRVRLEGEGYFRVSPDADRPFVVSVHQSRVEVLGTSFNVRAWDGRIHVAVVEGKVSLGVIEGEANSGVIIAAGQASSQSAGGLPLAPYAVDPARYLDWMRDEFAFQDAPLGEILYRLQRWHGVRFVLEDSSLATEHVTLNMRSRSLEEALDVVAALADLSWAREVNVVRLFTN
jgi:transmembrane sensor